jgi:TonB family protein
MTSTHFLRSLLLLCSLAAGSFAYGQKPSRIVFFTVRAEAGDQNAASRDDQTATDDIIRDDEILASVRPGTAFVHNTYRSAGAYTYEPSSSGPGHSNRLEIPALPGSILFVRISLNNSGDRSAHLDLVSSADFSAQYDRSKSLRQSLSDAGYDRTTDLTKDFAVTAPDLVPKRTALRTPGDTIFLDDYGQETSRNNAESFSLATADTAGTFLIRDFHWPELTLKSEYHWLTLDSESRTGIARRYYYNGRLQSRGAYRQNKEHGFWEYYRDTLPQAYFYTCYFTRGRLDGMLTSYFPGGQVKRKELHRLYADTVINNYGNGKRMYEADQDSIVSGQQFDEAGREIAFTPFRTLPRPSYALGSWLGGILRYPRDARRRGAEGQVLIQFVVNRRGRVREAEIIRSVDPVLDAEALRVVRLLPDWKPGSQDDEPMETYFTLPITFRLD